MTKGYQVRPMGFRDKESVVKAMLDQRAEIEGCIKAGESNDLMRNIELGNHKVYKEFCAAKSAGRMDTESMHDLIGYTVMAHQHGAIDGDYVLAMCPNEVAPDSKLTITAVDVSQAYLAGSDPDMLSCPFLAKEGEKADEVMAKLDSDLGITDTSSHAEVIEAMQTATDSMSKVTDEIQGILHSDNVADEQECEDINQSNPSAEQLGSEPQVLDTDSDGFAAVEVPSMEAANISQAQLDDMVNEAEEHVLSEETKQAAAADNSATPFDLNDNDVLQATLDRYEREISPQMHKESKAFSSAASAACAAEEARHGISPELMAQLEQLRLDNEAHIENMETVMANHETMASDYKQELYNAQAATKSATRMIQAHQAKHETMANDYKKELYNAQAATKSATRMMQTQQAKHEELLKEHQEFGALMQARASEAEVRVHAAVSAVQAFFARHTNQAALEGPKQVQSSQYPYVEIETEGEPTKYQNVVTTGDHKGKTFGPLVDEPKKLFDYLNRNDRVTNKLANKKKQLKDRPGLEFNAQKWEKVEAKATTPDKGPIPQAKLDSWNDKRLQANRNRKAKLLGDNGIKGNKAKMEWIVSRLLQNNDADGDLFWEPEEIEQAAINEAEKGSNIIDALFAQADCAKLVSDDSSIVMATLISMVEHAEPELAQELRENKHPGAVLVCPPPQEYCKKEKIELDTTFKNAKGKTVKKTKMLPMCSVAAAMKFAEKCKNDCDTLHALVAQGAVKTCQQRIQMSTAELRHYILKRIAGNYKPPKASKSPASTGER